eukprot:6587924-Ditylum_brightwellii.AAC.1
MPDEIRRCIETLKEQVMTQPTIALIKEENGVNRKLDDTIANIYTSKAIDIFLKQNKNYTDNKSKMFVVFVGQCTTLVVSKLKSETVGSKLRRKTMSWNC